MYMEPKKQEIHKGPFITVCISHNGGEKGGFSLRVLFEFPKTKPFTDK